MLEQTVQPWYLRAFTRSSDDEGISTGPERFSSELNTILDKGTKQFQAFACDQEKMLDVWNAFKPGNDMEWLSFLLGGTHLWDVRREKSNTFREVVTEDVSLMNDWG